MVGSEYASFEHMYICLCAHRAVPWRDQAAARRAASRAVRSAGAPRLVGVGVRVRVRVGVGVRVKVRVRVRVRRVRRAKVCEDLVTPRAPRPA
eukprot:scaffold11576_cov63-Phaeocystis_antarctica.AAC.2